MSSTISSTASQITHVSLPSFLYFSSNCSSDEPKYSLCSFRITLVETDISPWRTEIVTHIPVVHEFGKYVVMVANLEYSDLSFVAATTFLCLKFWIVGLGYKNGITIYYNKPCHLLSY
jgi:hypothetical protein